MAVKWTKTALANLVAIVEYIERDNAKRARSFALEIQAKTNSLAEFPGMGRPGRVIGTRELVIHPNYIIPYRVRGDVVEVLRVQHVARRWPPFALKVPNAETRAAMAEADEIARIRARFGASR